MSCEEVWGSGCRVVGGMPQIGGHAFKGFGIQGLGSWVERSGVRDAGSRSRSDWPGRVLLARQHEGNCPLSSEYGTCKTVKALAFR